MATKYRHPKRYTGQTMTGKCGDKRLGRENIKLAGSVTNETKLYRYISLGQFLSLVEGRQTYLTSVSQWYDRWESPIAQLIEVFVPSMKNVQARLYGQCWSLAAESDAMWRIYSPQGDGLLIETTAKQLRQIDYAKKGLLAPVIYFDDMNDLIGPISRAYPAPFNSAFYKRKAFAYEQEVRLVAADRRHYDCANQEQDRVYIDLDPVALINNVVVDPRAKDWYVDVVRQYCQRSGFAFVLRKSELYGSIPDNEVIQAGIELMRQVKQQQAGS